MAVQRFSFFAIRKLALWCNNWCNSTRAEMNQSDFKYGLPSFKRKQNHITNLEINNSTCRTNKNDFAFKNGSWATITASPTKTTGQRENNYLNALGNHWQVAQSRQVNGKTGSRNSERMIVLIGRKIAKALFVNEVEVKVEMRRRVWKSIRVLRTLLTGLVGCSVLSKPVP